MDMSYCQQPAAQQKYTAPSCAMPYQGRW